MVNRTQLTYDEIVDFLDEKKLPHQLNDIHYHPV